jgi:hypothetical protein
MDLLCDAVNAGAKVFHSTRRGFICTPRYVLGAPLEQLQDAPPALLRPLLIRLPLRFVFYIVRCVSEFMLFVNGPRHRRLGLPRYSVGRDPAPPTMDQRVYTYYAQGDISHKGDVRHLSGCNVMFDDGSVETVDIILCATGYEIDFPYLRVEYWRLREGAVGLLHKKIFHPYISSIFFIGLVHPIGAHWPVFEQQSKLVATYLRAKSVARHLQFDLLKAGRYALALEAPSRKKAVSQSLMVSKQNYILSLEKECQILTSHFRQKRFRSLGGKA